jgi:hypothetical protein
MLDANLVFQNDNVDLLTRVDFGWRKCMQLFLSHMETNFTSDGWKCVMHYTMCVYSLQKVDTHWKCQHWGLGFSYNSWIMSKS